MASPQDAVVHVDPHGDVREAPHVVRVIDVEVHGVVLGQPLQDGLVRGHHGFMLLIRSWTSPS
jgi:hypothetical protein